MNKKLESLILPLIKEAVKIIPRATKRPLENTQLQSHFGGQPYFEMCEEWPTTSDGSKLDFVFQLVNDGHIGLPSTIKLLQFFYDWNLNVFDNSDEGWRIKTYANISKEKSVVIHKPESDFKIAYCEIDFVPVKSLPDFEGLDNDYPEIFEVCTKLNTDEPWVPYENLTKKYTGEDKISSRVGGYPRWLQGNRRPKNVSGQKLEFLLQINSEGEADFVWGDIGVVYLFYNPENLADFYFEMQS